MVNNMITAGKDRETTRQPTDVWGDITRAGYEDRPVYRLGRIGPEKKKGNRLLRSIGSAVVVASFFWIAYVATSLNGLSSLLRPGSPSPPVGLLAAGLLILLLEKFLR